MFESSKDLKKYKAFVQERLEKLNEIFSLASIGNFSKNVDIPSEEDDFSELYAGIQVMIEVIREKIAEVESEKTSLEVERNQFSTLVKNLPVGIVIADVNSRRPVLVNEMAIEILGGIPDENQEWEFFIKGLKLLNAEGESYPTEEIPLLTTLKRKIPAEKNDIILKKDGKDTHLKIQSVPVLDDKGNMYSAFSVIHDVSREKELEKMKADFISLASHQLRTPLGSMRWMMEMLLKGDYGEVGGEAREVVERMQSSVIKMTDLVRELLSVFRIDDARAFDVPSEVDINELVTDVIGEIKPLADEREIDINYSSPKTSYKVKIDDVKFKEVLQNLLSNAVKYNKDKGKVLIKLDKKEGNYVISVSDTGIGIPENEKDRIFEKFYRTEEAARREIDGTGLGLYLVKAYIKRWGGEISFESTIGEGSVFTLALPENPNLTLLDKVE